MKAEEIKALLEEADNPRYSHMSRAKQIPDAIRYLESIVDRLAALVREQQAEIERLREVALNNDHEKRACESCGFVDIQDEFYYDVAYGQDGDAEVEPTCGPCRSKIQIAAEAPR